MVHFLIDLDDTVKTLLLCDDTIIELREFNYTVDLLDRLYVQLSKYNVRKLSVITHGVISSCLYENGCVAYQVVVGGETLLCSINEEDLAVIKALVERCNISDVTFYDKLGYYLAIGRKGVCYVDRHNGMQTLIKVDNANLVKVSVCTENSLQNKLDSFCAENNLQSVCYGDDLTDEDNLMYFANATMVLEDKVTVHDLSVFAYACLELCPSVSFNFDILKRTTKQILSVEAEVTTQPQEEILQIDDLENDLIAEMEKSEKKSKVSLFKPKSVMKKTDNKNEGKETDKKSTIVMFVSIICLCITAGIVVENFYLQRKLENAKAEITNMQTAITSAKSTVAAYEYCLNTDGNQALDLFNSVADAVSDNDGAVSNITYKSGSSMIVVDFDSEDSASTFKDAVSAVGAEISIVDESENDVSKYVATVQLMK